MPVSKTSSASATTKTAASATTTKRSKTVASQQQATPDITPAPIPATVVDSPTPVTPSPVVLPPVIQDAKSKDVTPEQGASESENVVSPATEDAKKNKPLKLARAKAQKWLDSLKKVQDAAPNKLVVSVINGMETLIAHEQNVASRANGRNLSDYNVFVQQHIKQVAAQNSNLSNKEVMIKIAELWQAHKASKAADATSATAV